MGKFIGLIGMLVAVYVALTIHTQGMERAFGGAFAPIEPAYQRDEPLATSLTPTAQLADPPTAPTRRVPVTHAVRDRVTADLEAGMDRYR